MRLKIFSVSLIVILFSLSASAQFRYKGQWSGHVSGSFNFTQGYALSIGMEKYFPNSIGSVAFNLDYLRNREFIKIMNFPISTTTLSVIYFYSLERVIKPPFFINAGIGLVGGVENFERNNVPEGVIQNFGTKWIYGLVFEPQFEFLIGRKVSMYFKPEIKYLPQARFNDLIFSPGLGVKIYF